jgi:DNA topoisomerase-1
VLDASPITNEKVQLFDGRYGLYVTDGTTNASLPKSTTPEEVTQEFALRLLAERAAAGPSKKASRRKAAKPAAAPRKKAAKSPAADTAPAAIKKPVKKAKKTAKKKRQSRKKTGAASVEPALAAPTGQAPF